MENNQNAATHDGAKHTNHQNTSTPQIRRIATLRIGEK
jgi:hypothetical protein